LAPKASFTLLSPTLAPAGAEAHLVARVEPAIAAGLAIGAPISARAKPDRILVFERLAGWVLAGRALVLMWLMLLGPALAVLALSFTD
jgi:hypothetical protein